CSLKHRLYAATQRRRNCPRRRPLSGFDLPDVDNRDKDILDLKREVKQRTELNAYQMSAKTAKMLQAFGLLPSEASALAQGGYTGDRKTKKKSWSDLMI